MYGLPKGIPSLIGMPMEGERNPLEKYVQRTPLEKYEI